MPTWEAMQQQMTAERDTLGIPACIAPLDKALNGWHPGELTYVGALLGRGKSSLLLQSMHYAATQGYGVGFISLEMSAQLVMRRLGAMHSGLRAHKFRDPRQLTLDERNHAKSSLFALGDSPIQICDKSGLRAGAIASLVRQMHANGARVVFIDFVQIIHEGGADRREAINRVSAMLRDTSKSLQILSLSLLSQVAERTTWIILPPCGTSRNLETWNKMRTMCC